MKQLSILFILFLLYSFTISTKFNGPQSCPSGYQLKCVAFGIQSNCDCFKKCPLGQTMKCKTVGFFKPSCSCV